MNNIFQEKIILENIVHYIVVPERAANKKFIFRGQIDMKVGCVKEIKNNEFRVGLTPDAAKSYINAGHVVYIVKGAGVGSGFLDEEYEAAGCVMIDTAKEVWDTVEMMV